MIRIHRVTELRELPHYSPKRSERATADDPCATPDTNRDVTLRSSRDIAALHFSSGNRVRRRAFCRAGEKSNLL